MERLFNSIESVCAFLEQDGNFKDCVIQGLDLTDLPVDWKKGKWKGAIFLGCTFDDRQLEDFVRDEGATLFPKFPGLPYNPYRPRLYTREELMEGYTSKEDNSLDKRIYDHFVAKGRVHCGIIEALAQRTHDHAIDDALADLLGLRNPDVRQRKKVAAIMGGHSTSRHDPFFKKAALTARGLARAGFFVASGGGPGIMEATNLGAYLAQEDDDALEKALAMLSRAEGYQDPGYIESAEEVIAAYPNGTESLAIPTWFYGHEPSNAFSTHIAKYFSNSLREDGLLAIAKYGVIFAPGSAGTTQEIFMDAAQNHYKTFEVVSPMIFLGRERYLKETGLYPMLERLAQGREYAEHLLLTDDPNTIVDTVQRFAEALDS